MQRIQVSIWCSCPISTISQTWCYTFLYWCSLKKMWSGLCWLGLTFLYIWCEETLTCKPIESLLIKFNLEWQTTVDKKPEGNWKTFYEFHPNLSQFYQWLAKIIFSGENLVTNTYYLMRPFMMRRITSQQWSDHGTREEIIWASEERNVSLARYLYNRVTKLHSTIPSAGRNV